MFTCRLYCIDCVTGICVQTGLTGYIDEGKDVEGSGLELISRIFL